MKVFVFPLDRALHIRRAQLQIEQSKLQTLIREREQLDLRSTTIRSEAADVRRAVSNQPQLTQNEISTMPDYQRGASQQLLKLGREKQDLVNRMQAQQHQTVEAERKVKLLERLRSKRFAEWDTLAQKEQENFAAEAYLARWTASH